jgi:hypothetical protein
MEDHIPHCRLLPGDLVLACGGLRYFQISGAHLVGERELACDRADRKPAQEA